MNLFNDSECDECEFGNDPCPIAWVNHECTAATDDARSIMENFVEHGRCKMRIMMARSRKERPERDRQMLLAAWAEK